MAVHYGRYELLERIAAGGMGEIFLARLSSGADFKKLLAIKRALPHLSGNPEFVRMFCSEATIAARLSHGNVVQVFDFGEAEGTHFLAMEYVHGVDLRTILQRASNATRPLGWRRAVEIGVGLCRGLDYLHRLTGDDGAELNLVHRDVSPPNVLVSFEGEVKLTDFGLARARLLTEESSGGKLKGKFSYMSPEQVEGRGLDRRSDLFSLGSVLYEAATGTKAFPILDDVRATLDRITGEMPTAPQELVPDLPPALGDTILRCLAKDPADRFATASELATALARDAATAEPAADAAGLREYLADLFPRESTPRPAAGPEPTLVSTRPIAERGPDAASPRTDDIVYPRRRRRGVLAALLVGLALLAAAAATVVTLLWTPQGRLRVQSRPAGALVVVDGRERGTTPLELDDLPVGRHLMVRLELPQHRAHQQLLVLVGDEEEKLIDVELPALTGAAVVASTPPGAAVKLDGRDTGLVTPAELGELALGRAYHLQLELAGYRPWTQDLTLESTEPVTVPATLQGLPAALRLESVPAGAAIFIDDRPSELRTPATLEGLTGGREISVRLEKKGHRAWQDTVTPQGGEESKIRARLSSLGARIWMSWQPARSLSIDGREIGEMSIGEVPLKPGGHLLRLRKNETGRRKTSFTLRLKVPEAGKKKSEPFRVNIDAHPWAEVDLDGRRMGTTAIFNVRLSAGEHLFLVKRKWDVPLEIKLRIEPET